MSDRMLMRLHQIIEEIRDQMFFLDPEGVAYARDLLDEAMEILEEALSE